MRLLGVLAQRSATELRGLLHIDVHCRLGSGDNRGGGEYLHGVVWPRKVQRDQAEPCAGLAARRVAAVFVDRGEGPARCIAQVGGCVAGRRAMDLPRFRHVCLSASLHFLLCGCPGSQVGRPTSHRQYTPGFP